MTVELRPFDDIFARSNRERVGGMRGLALFDRSLRARRGAGGAPQGPALALSLGARRDVTAPATPSATATAFHERRAAVLQHATTAMEEAARGYRDEIDGRSLAGRVACGTVGGRDRPVDRRAERRAAPRRPGRRDPLRDARVGARRRLRPDRLREARCAEACGAQDA